MRRPHKASWTRANMWAWRWGGAGAGPRLVSHEKLITAAGAWNDRMEQVYNGNSHKKKLSTNGTAFQQKKNVFPISNFLFVDLQNSEKGTTYHNTHLKVFKGFQRYRSNCFTTTWTCKSATSLKKAPKNTAALQVSPKKNRSYIGSQALEKWCLQKMKEGSLMYVTSFC